VDHDGEAIRPCVTFLIFFINEDFICSFFVSDVVNAQVMAIPIEIGWVLLTMAGPLEWSNAWVFYIGRLLTGK